MKRGVILLALAVLAAGGCVKDSIAPACDRQLPFISGGCYGKAGIKDVIMQPDIPCITLKPNNCNGGVLEVQSGCTEKVHVGDNELAPGESVTVEFVREGGMVKALKAKGNMASHNPAEDDLVTALGDIGGREFTITYTKTKPQC
jgi:hypothetical protein